MKLKLKGKFYLNFVDFILFQFVRVHSPTVPPQGEHIKKKYPTKKIKITKANFEHILSILLFFVFCLFSDVLSQYKCDTTFGKKDTLVECKALNEKGKIQSIRRYRNGKYNGNQEEYYGSGKVYSIMSYKDGCPFDSSVFFYKDGKIKIIKYYDNCLCNGPLLMFNENGDTLHKGRCENGKTIGLDETWYEPEKRETRTHYNDAGKKHGLFETWRKDGTRIDSIVYNNGKMIEIREYFVNGKERVWEEYKKTDSSSFLINAVYHDLNGKISGKVVNGEGEYIVHDENGRPVFKKVVSKGIRMKEEDL